MNYLPAVTRLFKALSRYHRHSVVGIENVPTSGPALIVANHSLATYDNGLLWYSISRELGREPYILADRALFKIPVVRNIVQSYGSVEGGPKVARDLLNDGNLVMVNPGGMRESLLPSSKKYQLDLSDRKGFVRLAIDTQVPVILSACPAADDLYTVHGSKLTDKVYDELKLPLPFATGVLGTPLPHKARLTHFLSKPIDPPSPDADSYDQAVDLFHTRLCTQLQDMMNQWQDKVDVDNVNHTAG